MTKRRHLARALSELETAIYAVDRAVTTSRGLTWQEAALVLRHIHAQQVLLKAAAEAAEAAVLRGRRRARLRPRDAVEVEGVGVVSVHRTADRKQWDHEGVAHEVVEAHLASDPDGVAPTPWEVRDWIMQAVGPSYWRIGALKALGISPDDYSTVIYGHDTVKIEGGPVVPGEFS